MARPHAERSIHAQLELARAEREVRRKREWRRRLAASLAGHGVLLALVAYAPAPKARPLPPVVTVDLVAAVRPRAPAARTKPMEAAPEPAPAPPPPPVQKKVVLPKEAPAAEARPKPRPEKKPVARPPRRPRPKELDYEDALAKLREELGEPEPAPAAEPGEAPEPEAPAEDTGSSGAGVQVSPEVARWVLETVRHVRATYVTPPEFRGRGLRTCLTVLLTSDGRVVGEPRMARSSGDVFWDDNAVRATLRASPLPAPPEEGDWTFCFPTEESH
ncbi:MAG: TonB C-terminal domain-containing protein [Myxococcota bacterium]